MALLAELKSKVAAWFAPKSLGQRGEEAAAKFLRKLGYPFTEETRNPAYKLFLL